MINVVFADIPTNGPTFDQSVYYQGDNGSVQITVVNNYKNFQITTKQCYIQFDWQVAGNTAFQGQTPVIATGQSYTFTFNINFPSNIAVGPHSYKIIWVDAGFIVGKVTLWSGTIQVHDSYEKIFIDQNSLVSNKYNSRPSYTAPNAISLVNQATTALNLADQLSQSNKWQEAITQLNNASNYLDQAASAQSNYDIQKAQQAQQAAQQQAQQAAQQATQQTAQQQQTTFNYVYLLVGIVGVVIVALYVRSRSKNSTSTAPSSKSV